jgi:hypothetical protein
LKPNHGPDETYVTPTEERGPRYRPLAGTLPLRHSKSRTQNGQNAQIDSAPEHGGVAPERLPQLPRRFTLIAPLARWRR